MRYYVFRREEDGKLDYFQDCFDALVTEDVTKATIIAEDEVSYLHLPYIEFLGFKLVDIEEVGVEFDEEEWFRPPCTEWIPALWPHPAGQYLRPQREFVGEGGKKFSFTFRVN